MFMKTSTKIKSYLTLVITQKIKKITTMNNNLVIGKLKHVTCSIPSKGFARLKSKQQSFITEDNHDSKKAKDIYKNAVGDKLKYEDYKNVLFNRSHMRHEMNRIQSRDHKIGLYKTDKISFSYDD